MEQLKINNFLTIQQADVEIRRFTIFIGPQANGKSVIAKILYFFRNFLTTHFIRSVENKETKLQLVKQAIENFEQIFPRYTWVDQKFELIYTTKDIKLRISRLDSNNRKANLEFDFSDNLLALQKKAKTQLRKKSKSPKTEKDRFYQQRILFYEILENCVYESPLGHNFQRSVFIPASRSFFANLQKNVFSFLANNIAIDPLIKQFGSAYELSKQEYDRRRIIARREEDSLVILREEIKKETEKIISGQYVYEDGEDWIMSGKKKINLANASSGQQEALPLLVVLSSWLNRNYIGSKANNFFIEEPEAHLFPLSQRNLVGIFSKFYYSLNSNFILTTHSPYILTALNNLIMASNIIGEKGQDKIKDVQEIIGKDRPIEFNHVSAYTIQDGILKSILDSENQLIGSSIIDSVSDEFDKVFDDLLKIYLN